MRTAVYTQHSGALAFSLNKQTRESYVNERERLQRHKERMEVRPKLGVRNLDGYRIYGVKLKWAANDGFIEQQHSIDVGPFEAQVSMNVAGKFESSVRWKGCAAQIDHRIRIMTTCKQRIDLAGAR